MENSRNGKVLSRCLTTVLLPAPDGAEKMITFLFIVQKYLNLRVDSKNIGKLTLTLKIV